MKRSMFQLMFSPEGAAGAGAGAGAGDEKTPEAKPEEKKPEEKKPEEKPAGEAKPEEKAGEKKPEAKPEEKAGEKKPEEKKPTEYKLTISKDAAPFVDNDDLKTIEAFARDKGLTPDQAQAIVDERVAAIAAQSASFRAITEADPEIGGDKLADTEKFSKVALDKLYPKGTKHGDEMRTLLVKTGYGNNRIIVRHFAMLGRQQAEDGGMGAGPAGGEKDTKDVASKLYDHPTSKT